MIFRPLLAALFLLAATAVFGQGPKPMVSGSGIIYSSEKSGSFGLTTNHGWTVGYQRGSLKTYYKTTLFSLSLSEVKHEKEQRQASDPNYSRSWRPYVYGKRNALFAVRAGWGAKRYFTEKARQRGVVVGFSYMAGPVAGILKPYYLALKKTGDNPGQGRTVVEKYSDDNADIFLDRTKIIGAASFFKGFADPQLTVGGQGSLAIHLDWGAFDEYLKALRGRAAGRPVSQKGPHPRGRREPVALPHFLCHVAVRAAALTPTRSRFGRCWCPRQQRPRRPSGQLLARAPTTASSANQLSLNSSTAFT